MLIYNNSKTVFDFGEFMNVKGETGLSIQKRYNELCEFILTTCCNYFNFAVNLGQPSYVARIGFETENNKILDDLNNYGELIVWSPSRKGGLTDLISYEILKTKIRNWYNEDMSTNFVKCFVMEDGTVGLAETSKQKPDTIILNDSDDFKLLSKIITIETLDDDGNNEQSDTGTTRVNPERSSKQSNTGTTRVNPKRSSKQSNTGATRVNPKRSSKQSKSNIYNYNDDDDQTYKQPTDFYEIPQSIRSGDNTNQNSNSTWQVADIYPAYKVLICYFMLLLFLPNYAKQHQEENKTEVVKRYLKMIASYMIHVHLFNSFCSIKMNNSWNSKIGNTHVYKKIIINRLSKQGLSLGHMEIDTDTLEELSGFEAGKDIIKGKIDIRIDGFLDALTDEGKKTLYLKLITNVNFMDKLRYKLEEIYESGDNIKINEVLSQSFEEALNEKGKIKEIGENNQLLEFHEKMKKSEDLLLSFFDDTQNNEEMFQNIIQFIDEKIEYNKNDLKMFLRIINSISLNYIRKNNLIKKVEQILGQILETLGRREGELLLCDIDYLEIFGENLRILLFLFENGFIALNNIPEDFLIQKLDNQNTIKYFHKELTLAGKINEFMEHYGTFEYEIQDENLYEENRSEGEEPIPICSLIRGDFIDDFITYTDKNKISLNDSFEPSEFETNFMLLQEDRISLVEYAAFNGSIEIFKYLIGNIKIKNVKRLVEFAIHGNCIEILHMIEEKYKFIYDYSHLNISIMCHTNDIVNYILDKIVFDPNVSTNIACSYGIKAYNFAFISKSGLWDKNNIKILIINDYYNCVHYLLRNCNIDLAPIIDDIRNYSVNANDSIKLVLKQHEEQNKNDNK